MGGAGLELSREPLPSACTDASLFFSAARRAAPGRAGAEGSSTEARWGGLTGLLDAEHQEGFVFYLLCCDKLFRNKVHLLPVACVYCMPRSQH